MDMKTSQMSDDIREFAKAFLIAKRLFTATGKDSQSNRHKYASIDAVYAAVESALFDNNIFITHAAEYLGDNVVVLNTRLIHSLSGQFMQDTRLLVSDQPGNQAKGSANTYMRRYAVLSLCALSTEDDDGEDERKYIEKKKEDLSKVISSVQVRELSEILGKFPYEVMEKLVQDIYEKYGIDNIRNIPLSKYIEARRHIAEGGK